MPVTKQCTVHFPIVIMADDYHEFSNIADNMSNTLGIDIKYTELGYDCQYFAAFHPENYTPDPEEMEYMRNHYNLDTN